MSLYYLVQLGAMMALSWTVGLMAGERKGARDARKAIERRQAAASLEAVAAARGRHPSSR